MSEAPLQLDAELEIDKSFEQSLRSRQFLVSRLVEIVSWPQSRIPAHERELAADVLVGLLRNANETLRARCAQRLSLLTDAPKILLRYLARDVIAVSAPLLTDSPALDDADLLDTIEAGVKAHWRAIIGRRTLGPVVAQKLISLAEPEISEAVLRHPMAVLSRTAIDFAVRQSRETPALAALIARRPEAGAAQALTMFWWADHPTRMHLLRRFSVDRAVLISEMSDIFAMASEEKWSDAETRKAIALIERRQRNRSAAERSPYGSIEGAIAAALTHGVDKAMVSEIAYLAGIRPSVGGQIFVDRGGEALAVLCKSAGVKRDKVMDLWRALRRPSQDPDSPMSPLGRVLIAFDTLSTAKAQTVLRYWNWSLSTDSSGAAASDVSEQATEDRVAFRPALRSASLVFGWKV